MSIPTVGRGSARGRSRVSVPTDDGCSMVPTVVTVSDSLKSRACRGRYRLSVPIVGRPEAVVECRSVGTDGWSSGPTVVRRRSTPLSTAARY